MLKLNIGTLRWLLLAVNFSVLVLLGFTIKGMFGGTSDGLTIVLPDPTEFAIREAAISPNTNRYTRLISNLNAKAPAPREPVVAPPPCGPAADSGWSSRQLGDHLRDFRWRSSLRLSPGGR